MYPKEKAKKALIEQSLPKEWLECPSLVQMFLSDQDIYLTLIEIKKVIAEIKDVLMSDGKQDLIKMIVDMIKAPDHTFVEFFGIQDGIIKVKTVSGKLYGIVVTEVKNQPKGASNG